MFLVSLYSAAFRRYAECLFIRTAKVALIFETGKTRDLGNVILSVRKKPFRVPKPQGIAVLYRRRAKLLEENLSEITHTQKACSCNFGDGDVGKKLIAKKSDSRLYSFINAAKSILKMGKQTIYKFFCL